MGSREMEEQAPLAGRGRPSGGPNARHTVFHIGNAIQQPGVLSPGFFYSDATAVVFLVRSFMFHVTTIVQLS